MKLLIIAGERSGDMHAARVAERLRLRNPRIELIAAGGDFLKEAGVQVKLRYENFSSMGITTLVTSWVRVARTVRLLKRLIAKEQPDAILLVDFSSINLILARHAKKRGIQIYYYIAPKVWAWKKHRLKRLRNDLDNLMVVLPFEKEFFESHGIAAHYVGSPVLEHIRKHNFEDDQIVDTDHTNIALLLGSRVSEIHTTARIIHEVIEEQPTWFFHIASVSSVPFTSYAGFDTYENVIIHKEKTYELLKLCNAAVVVSGTATLEAALLNIPQVVIYRTNWISFQVAKRMITIQFVSLVNLILGKSLVQELIQGTCTSEKITSELVKMLNDSAYCATMLEGYQEVREKLGNEIASNNVAEAILEANDKLSSP
ncbi:MAG: lipid-A-disaccharide synthase [Bacteroidota bacterium]